MLDTPIRLSDWLPMIREEFNDPPGLRLTAGQACERWPLEPARVVLLLDALVRAGYLRQSADGVYFRRPDAIPEA